MSLKDRKGILKKIILNIYDLMLMGCNSFYYF